MTLADAVDTTIEVLIGTGSANIGHRTRPLVDGWEPLSHATDSGT